MANFVQYLPVVSTVFQAAGAIGGGVSKDNAARFQAQQLETAAGQERAAAQRAAEEQRRQARLAGSRLQAVAGGAGSDPTVMNLAADIAGEGEYRALTALFEGESRARGMEGQARAARYEGKQARTAGMMKAATTVFSAGSNSMLEKYGGGDGLSQGDRRKIGVY